MIQSYKHRVQILSSLLKNGVQEKVFSGAQAAICFKSEDEITCASVGTTTCDGTNPIEEDTLFDIASITKLFTATAALLMVEQKQLSLDSTLESFLPELNGRSKGKASLRELLAHEAKFQAWLPLFESIPLEERGSKKARESVINSVISSDSVHNTVYSDLGFVALTQILERVSGLPLDQLIEQYVSKPMDLKSVHFRPVGGMDLPKHSIAATENCPWRGRVLIGEVHDDNAWTMGGISGHSGLFATAKDVARFGAHWLETLKGNGWLSKDLASEATTPRAAGRGLGWDMISPEGSSAGTLLSRRSFGHLGFTGCSLWVDPDRGMSIALNTNHVHFGRDKEKIRAFRPLFHNVVVKLQ